MIRKNKKIRKQVLKQLTGKLSAIMPIETILSIVGIDQDSDSDSESEQPTDDLDLQDLKKENTKRNFVLDTMMVQTGALRLCKEELIFKKHSLEIKLGQRTLEGLSETEKTIFDEQTELSKLKNQEELKKEEAIEKQNQKKIKANLNWEFQQYAYTFLY